MSPSRLPQLIKLLVFQEPAITDAEIARRLGISRERVRQLRIREGIEIARGWTKGEGKRAGRR